MAQLSKDPKGWELEDFISSHFVSRGCYVETGVKERCPDEILEIDSIWTDYRREQQEQHPVEVKSGDWGIGDIFKFYGWTRYLGLPPGEFIHKEPCGRVDPTSLKHIESRTGLALLHVAKPEDAEPHLKSLGLPDPHWEDLPEIWRYSFWAQRRLLKCLSAAISQGVCPNTAKAAKEYHQLINDAVFFLSDVRDRVTALMTVHFQHQALGLSAAYEIDSGKVDFVNPPQTDVFKKALFHGKYFPIQACLYLAHRARLYILKALVDYSLARDRGEIPQDSITFGQTVIDVTGYQLTSAMVAGLRDLKGVQSFRLLPVFWQVFLWSWGGFLRMDRLGDEYADLERETGVPVAEIPLALSAFDKLFPVGGGWFRQPRDDSRSVLILMPAAIRGIGAVRRKARKGVKRYVDLGFTDCTAFRLASDHNTGAHLLDWPDADLAK